ncbi:MAG: mannose-1-phosphate guanylyltransferase/mannose-6-phosphate isomerase [Abyssibacter sp.]|nr:mannose-1-phosphate guanylyltransferase/mannose-6-phosphate isomerase [Abyssibacter sp.]MCK5859676.1 mannose-1-phosphate guanylyltransferase/mannose-6-phosphate isomerase [Abyssibacter sp.]
MIVPVLLAGGSGTRLWPMSRGLFPKQFLKLAGDQTMLQATVERGAALPDVQPPMVICGEDHRFIVAEQLQQTGETEATIVLEPIGRNTAPAAAVAATLVAERYGRDAVLILMAADHVITDTAGFARTAETAAALAAEGHLVTFGVTPTRPETGYGYIQTGDPVGDGFTVKTFREKPDTETAEQYIASGDFLWNSGMFVFQAGTLLDEMREQAPDILDAAMAAVSQGQEDLDFLRLDKTAFAKSPEDSIDYAVMEKTARAAVVPLSVGWDDVGSWTYMGTVNTPDGEGNVLQGDVLTHDTTNTFVRSNDGRLVATVGLDNTVIVDTTDAVLVASRDRVQDVKAIVGQLKAAKRSEALHHAIVYRPWGSYETIALGARFQVKRIVVKPKCKLSLQMHHHRAEHWIVVQGTAIVTKGDETLTLTEDQSTYIPLGTTHRLENPGVIPLELIEVQSGSYLGEDDIVRFQDDYNRA